MGWDMSNILVNLSSNGGGGGDSELSSRVTALETTVGDASSGLVKDVDDLETTVGDASSGLVKDVDDLETTTSGLDTRVTALEQGGGGGEYTVTAFEAKTPTTTSYEDYATITLPAGAYHVIAGVYSTNTSYPTTGVRIQTTGGQVCCVGEASGIQKPCCMGIFYQEVSTNYKVQIRGNSAGGVTNGYYLVKKLADYTPPNNNRKRSATKK